MNLKVNRLIVKHLVFFSQISNCQFSSNTKPHDVKDFGVYDIVKPSLVSERLLVPSYIKAPSYVGISKLIEEDAPSHPEIKSFPDIVSMRKSCGIASALLESAKNFLQVGVTTDEIDKMVHNLCIDLGVYPSPLGYMGFPKSICTSVNNVACHGIPDDRPLKDGDIINIDISVYADGFHGDCSATFAVGDVDEKGKHLIEATELCLLEGIAACKEGEYFSVIGQVIADYAAKLGYDIIPVFTGHGIGRYFHGPPDIYHTYNDYPGTMKNGMIFTIEPVLTQGDSEVIILEDGWTAVTLDNARAAQFEHTILIEESGAQILTKREVD